MLVGYFEFIHLTKGLKKQCVRKTCRVEKNMTVGRGKKNTMQRNILVQEECDLAWGHDLKKKKANNASVSLCHIL